MKNITEVTFNDIVTIIKYGATIQEEFKDFDTDYEREYINTRPADIEMTFNGKLDEMDFLKRIFDLKNLPSTDYRVKNAELDIFQHTVANDDFEYFWFFDYEPFDFREKDETLLKFLCEMFHPAVRNEREPWREFLKIFNELLKHDGYEIYPVSKISGRDVYGWKRIGSDIIKAKQIEIIKEAFTTEYMDSQIKIMSESIYDNPTEAIGKAKELCESCCKTILGNEGIDIDKNWKISSLTKETCKILELTPDDIDESKKGANIIKAILGNLSVIPTSIAELRNSYGSGHGKNSKFKGLTSRHANLAVGAAVTFAHFLWETYTTRKEYIK